MTHASLFSGIGGFDLAAEWMSWTNLFNCEIEDFPRKVLKYHFPNAIQHDDIKKTDFTIYRGRVDVLSGGFPCQPFSVAGKRLGKNDERHLWPEMYRAIQEIRPKWIVGENVRGILNWSDGLVLDEVYSDLENEGYEIQSFVLPASGINAPHKRERVWIVAANTKDGGYRGRISKRCTNEGRSILQDKQAGDQVGGKTKGCCGEQSITNTNNDGQTSTKNRKSMEKGNDNNKTWKIESIKSKGCSVQKTRIDTDTNLQRCEERHIPIESKEQRFNSGGNNEARKDWTDFPTQSPVRSGDDGFPLRMDGITISKWRNESIKAYGNAIVPQIAYRLFKAIQYTENQLT